MSFAYVKRVHSRRRHEAIALPELKKTYQRMAKDFEYCGLSRAIALLREQYAVGMVEVKVVY